MSNEPTPSHRAEGHQFPDRPVRDTSTTNEIVYEMSVEDCRALDAAATSDYGIPSVLLMENAAIRIAQHVVQLINHARHEQIVICCGPGNNGGDGFALARQLDQYHIPSLVVIDMKCAPKQGDSIINFNILNQMNHPIIEATEYLESRNAQNAPPGMIIDAIFGTGLKEPITGLYAELIDSINNDRQHHRSLVLSVDVPSGFDAQTGKPVGESVVIADRTISLAAMKEGYRQIEAQEYIGEVFVEPIGIPHTLCERYGQRVQSQSRTQE